MHLGLLTPGFSAHEKDWCIPALLNLVRELARHHEVDVFTLRYPYYRGRYPVYGATVHAFAGAQSAGLSRLPLMGRVLASIVAQGRRRPFDMLHGLWADEPGFLAVTAGRLLRVPTIVALLGGELVSLPDIGYGGQLSRIGRWLVRSALHQATRVTVGSNHIRRLAQPHVSSDRLLLLPLGVDTEVFYPESQPSGSAPLAKGKIKLLHVASLTPVKDQITLLQMLSQVVVKAPQVHLHIAGAGPLRRNLEGLAEKLGVTAHVTFHGAVPHEQLPAYYRAADLCVLTSRYESQGMVTLEAAACARSTVGTAVGLLPDLVPVTQAVPVQDARALAEAVLATLPGSQALAVGRRASWQAIAAGYTLRQKAQELCGLYHQLAATPV